MSKLRFEKDKKSKPLNKGYYIALAVCLTGLRELRVSAR